MIDQKTLEEWKAACALLREMGPSAVAGGAGSPAAADYGRIAGRIMAAVPALIAEVERLRRGQDAAVFACWNCGADLTATEGTYRAALQAGNDLAEDNERLRGLLREVEGEHVHERGRCPVCRKDIDERDWSGHASDCRLAAALKGEP